MIYKSVYHNDNTSLDLVRYSIDELKTLSVGTTVYALHMNDRSTELRFFRLRVSGKPKTWKTRPGDVDIPTKQGLYGPSHRTVFREGTRYSGYALYRLAKEGEVV